MPTSTPRLPRSNEVGLTLRRLREGAQVSTRELARRLAVAPSYVSKIELGHLAPRVAFCLQAAKALRLPRTDRELLVALAALREAEYASITGSSEALEQAQQAVRHLERDCRRVRCLQLSLVPGLLQTPAYAQAVLSRLTKPSRVGGAVVLRTARQRLLEDRSRRFQFLVSDWALGPHWCSRPVMKKQLEHLARLSTYPNVEIRILPRWFRFPATVRPMVTGFEVLDEAAVILDALTGFTTIRKIDEVLVYAQSFDRALAGGGSCRSSRERPGEA